MPFSFARQAIYNSRQDIKGYELLYRSSSVNRFPEVDGDEATMNLLENISDILHSITMGKLAFINYTYNLILKDIPLVTPKKTAVVEILENVPAKHDVIKKCQKLSEKGYTIALDDFTYRRELEPLILLADIIKIDFQKEPLPVIKKEVETLRKYGVKLLAEKVETREEAKIASENGFDYFQGNFFSKAEMVVMKDFKPVPARENWFLPRLSPVLN
jgi:c-di-GMP-related signal transduction protein